MRKSKQTVAVVGGGVIGLSCAICLARHGINVQLFAKQPPSDLDLTSYDARTYALNLTSINLLETMNVMPLIARYSNFETLKVWDANSDGHVSFDASDIGVARLGVIVEHKCLLDALWQHINQLNIIDCIDAQIISAHVSTDGIVEAELHNGERRQLSLIIGADGIHSRIRQLMNVQWVTQNYQQTAFAYIVRTTKDHQAAGWQQFSANGILAFLPLAHRICSIVWSCPNSSKHRLSSLSAEDLMKITSQEIAELFGELSLLSSVSSFELRGGYVNQYVVPGMMLIGDAAHNIHPLAGQGANLGFADLTVLLDLLANSQSKRLSYPLLRRYQRTVKGRNQCMKIGLEGLLWLFSNQSPLWIYARTGGLRIVDKMPTLKKFFIHQAGGVI